MPKEPVLGWSFLTLIMVEKKVAVTGSKVILKIKTGELGVLNIGLWGRESAEKTLQSP